MKRWVLTALIIGTITAPILILAAEPFVPCSGPDCQACHLVEMGQRILKWLIGIMATIIAVIVVIAGLKMATSGGNEGKVGEAKHMMTNAVVGFIILLTAVLVVDTVVKMFINQDYIGAIGSGKATYGPWNEIKCVTPTVTPPVQPPPSTAACPISPLTPLTTELATRMEGGETRIWDNTHPQLKSCVEKFIGKVGGTVTSVYRPPEYQSHLYEIFNRWCKQGLKTTTNTACESLKATVSSEISRHFGASWDCGAVASSNSTHSSGRGVDISGIDHGSAAVKQAASESCLVWKNYSGDPVHYDFTGLCTCN